MTCFSQSCDNNRAFQNSGSADLPPVLLLVFVAILKTKIIFEITNIETYILSIHLETTL